MAAGKSWSRECLLLALNLYHKLPFGQFHQNNAEIVEIARRMGRTPGSMAMKLCNLASLDPAERARGIAGLGNASKLDRRMWKEFHENWSELAPESERLIEELMREPSAGTEEEIESYPGELTEALHLAKVRRKQSFFRGLVLASYDRRCCITGLAVPELLNASHIVPWNLDESNRLNPRNGLCLNALHDRAFDRGLISVSPDLMVLISGRLKDSAPSHAKDLLLSSEGRTIGQPQRFAPAPDFLQWHATNVFAGA